ncbi:MAG: hypothetical protein ACRD28_03150 [Acidobacteriaceae bacterium]
MKKKFWKIMSCVGVAALAFAVAPVAEAQCGLLNKPIKPMSWNPQYRPAIPSLLRTDFDGDEDRGPSIVGMWHVIFTAKTQNGETIPTAGGAVIDNSVVVWHRDGTEIMNSSRSAQDGNFCLGVWERTGQRSYLLNHIPWQGNVYDPTAPVGSVGNPQAGAQIIERVQLSPDGNSYSGTFNLRAYDTSGNVYVWFTGVLSAKRITPETPFKELF